MAQITILVGGVSFKKKKEAFLRGGPAEGLWVTPAAQVHTLGSLEVVPSPRARRLWHMEPFCSMLGFLPDFVPTLSFPHLGTISGTWNSNAYEISLKAFFHRQEN